MNSELKIDIEKIAQIIVWILWLAVFISLKAQIFPMDKAVILSTGTILLLMGTAYFNALFIIPRFFKRGKIHQYLLTILGLLILILTLHFIFTHFLFDGFMQNSLPSPDPRTLHWKTGHPNFRIVPIFFLTVTTIFLSTIYKLAKEFLKKEHQNTHLEKEKIKHELNFLRSQINPHFLFNALNNLHSTVQLRPEKAGDFVLKLGEMLRYVLEDCKKNKVSLADEIKYLENYIFFQKQKDEELQNIKFRVGGNDPSAFYLEPMLLIALVENAFQHSYSEDSKKQYIDIQIELNSDVFKFTTQNNLSINPISFNPSNQKQLGLGLKNIRRRLELLYPNQFTFIHEKREATYFAELTIKI